MSLLLQAIFARADHDGDRTALDDGSRQLLYRDLPNAVAAMAGTIRDAIPGFGPVAIELDNGIDWVIADLALLSLGRPNIPLPAFFTKEQRAAALANAGAVGSITVAGIILFDHAIAAVPPGAAKISYTSGSTGDPKGICLDDRLMLQTAQAILARLGEDFAGIHFPILPLAVLLENVAGLYATLLAGGRYLVRSAAAIGLANPFAIDDAQLVTAIEASNATSLILVPEYLACIVDRLERTGVRLDQLRLVAVGGSRVPLSLIDRADRAGLPVVQGYGLTECGSVVSLEAFGERDRGTVGHPLDHVAVSLASDGEIVIAGHFHLGTVGDARVDGPILTGDIGAIDGQGRLSIIGRKSSLIITSFGRNVAPEWIEEQLVAQPQIAQAMVYGDGETMLRALIVPSAPDADIAAGVAAANAALPAYAQIGLWQASRPFTPAHATLTPNGRLRRAAILDRLATRPFFERLCAETGPARARLFSVPQLQAGLAGRISLATYLAYLAQAYHHVRHTVPLMRLARSGLMAKSMLVEALDDYIAEEEGHEQWILNDIRAAGGDADAVVLDGPSPATACMVDHAYATLRDGNPAAFFGMVFVLEGTSIALASNGAEAVRASLGLPHTAFTYLTSHGALDQDHMRFFETLMNRLTDPADQDAIVAMANDIFDLFGGLFAAIAMEDDRAAA
ncbi:AMP-binding protein [Sphingobium chlorophenolicum]|uniref:AMP-dependent synthetase and ligase n=1 Tax=Sphingobium chlorophenolicum TaxID=46429 RepID=A0A081RCG4_SPHCR|nr:AMP-binding protein [Sphingobium chlorophenolicum]KEQ52887.1 AMP-dependent synthetase and ligase [Sphingobium chlorophenolicum]